MFVTTTTSSDTAPNNAFIADQDGISDKVLDRQMTINSASPVMTFRNNFDTEFSDGVYWDGGVVEISTPSISGGDFLDVTDSHVGGTITSGGYTGEISSDASNPLAGRMAWSGSSGGYIDTVINLGDQPSQYIAHVEKIEIVDASTIDIILSKPAEPLLSIIAAPGTPRDGSAPALKRKPWPPRD